MEFREILAWIDPLDEYKLNTPMCVLDDFACWEFNDSRYVQFYKYDDGLYRLVVIDNDYINRDVQSADLTYILQECNKALAVQQYEGVFI